MIRCPAIQLCAWLAGNMNAVDRRALAAQYERILAAYGPALVRLTACYRIAARTPARICFRKFWSRSGRRCQVSAATVRRRRSLFAWPTTVV